MKKVVTMGEIMLRLSAPGYQKIQQSGSFGAVYGGGEANVAISLSQLGLNTSFVSKLPDNALGESAKQYLNQFGVNTDHIIYGGDRLGIYFLEKGFSVRSSKVIYDRKHSAFSESKLEEYDFDSIFTDADWFHISGITPALNDELFYITKKALEVAKEKGITTSCDLNFRSSLWSFEDARKRMTELAEFVDICLGVEPLQLLGENGKDLKDAYQKPLSVENYQEIMTMLHERYHFKHIAMTFRENLSVNRNRLNAMLSDGNEFYVSPKVEVEFVDRVGGGDSFSAGMVYALIQNYQPQDAINFATACFALKHTIEGDANLLHHSDIEQFVKQKESLTISR
jgi:2-dehydro-3-deoxygluconokinase